MKGWGRREKMGAAAAMGLLFWICGCSSLPKTSAGQEPGAVQAQRSTPEQAGVPSASVEVPYIPTPRHMTLCGEPVPLNREDVYERFDREFTLVVYNHAQVYLWLKRMDRYFPMIEERLRYYGLPDDLKYLAIVESDLLPNSCSPKGAAGLWQFMPGTGAAYGLEQKKSVDKRYDTGSSTDSAFLLLKNLYQKYHSWAMAIAAYNCGDKRILDESRIQGASSYYDLKLPQETERYVFRILAVKAVLSNPRKYGYDLPRGAGYKVLKVDRVNVSLSRAVPIRAIAEAAGTTYRVIKWLNPVFRSDDIPAGKYEIDLPAGAGKLFAQNFREESLASSGVERREKPAPRKRRLSARHKRSVRLAWASSQSGKASDEPAARAKHSGAKRKTRLAKATHVKARHAVKSVKARPSRAKPKAGSARAHHSRVEHKTRLAKATRPRVKHKVKPAKANHARAKKRKAK